MCHLVRETALRPPRGHRGLAVCDAKGIEYSIMDPVQRTAALKPPSVDISPSGHAHLSSVHPADGPHIDNIVQDVTAAVAHPDHTLQWALGRCGLEPPAIGAGPSVAIIPG